MDDIVACDEPINVVCDETKGCENNSLILFWLEFVVDMTGVAFEIESNGFSSIPATGFESVTGLRSKRLLTTSLLVRAVD